MTPGTETADHQMATECVEAFKPLADVTAHFKRPAKPASAIALAQLQLDHLRELEEQEAQARKDLIDGFDRLLQQIREIVK